MSVEKAFLPLFKVNVIDFLQHALYESTAQNEAWRGVSGFHTSLKKRARKTQHCELKKKIYKCLAV